MHDWLRDLRYSTRQLGRTPGFTLVAVLTLGLGIAAFTAFYSLANAVVFRPGRLVDLDGLLHIQYMYEPGPGSVRARFGPLSQPGLPRTYLRQLERDRPPSIEAIAGAQSASAVIDTSSRAERVFIEIITGSYPTLYRLSIGAGRWLTPQDDQPGAAPAVVISARMERSWFGRGAGLGQAIRVTMDSGEAVSATVVGVAPSGFRGGPLGMVDVWLPLETLHPDRFSSLPVVVRPSTASTSAVRADLMRRTNTPGPLGNGMMTDIIVRPLTDLVDTTPLTLSGLGLVALAALVLLAACANLANMLYARHATRLGEVAVRLSLGARPARIVRLFALEATLIGLAAAAIGLLAALAGVRAFAEAFPSWQIDRTQQLALDLSTDYSVFAAAFASGALAALAVGLFTAWRATRVPILRILGGSGATPGMTAEKAQLRRSFVAVQVTAALVLVMGAGIALQNLQVSVLRRVYFDAESTLVARIERPHDENRTRTRIFYDRLEARLRTLDGVTASAVASSLPAPIAPRPQWTNVYAVPDIGFAGEPRRLDILWSRVTPGYHDAIGLPIVRGRSFTAGDVDGGPLVAIVSESVAAWLWPGGDAIGRELVLGVGDPLVVVGITADPASGHASRDPSHWRFSSNALFVPLAQWWREPSLVVLRGDSPTALAPRLQSLVRELDPAAAALDSMTVEAMLDQSLGPVRALSALSTILGLVALGIAMLGVYGVMTYLVGLRTREFGVRLALGARPGQIVRLVLDRTVHVVLVGLLAGVLTATLASQLVQHQVFGLSPNPLAVWIVAPLVILALGVAAGYLPARRASRIDPNVALREV